MSALFPSLPTIGAARHFASRSIRGIVLLLALAGIASGVQEQPAASNCNTSVPKSGWTAAEREVWRAATHGQVADLLAFTGSDTPGPLRHPLTRDMRRAVRASFVERLLLSPELRCHLTRDGLRIRGAWLIEPLSISHAELQHVLWLDATIFDGAVELSGVKSAGVISLEDSEFSTGLSINNAQLGQELNLSSITMSGPLALRNTTIAGNLFLRDARLQRADLLGIHVSNQLDASRTHIRGTLDLSGAHIGGPVFMRKVTAVRSRASYVPPVPSQVPLRNMLTGVLGQYIDQMDEITLRGAKIGGNLEIDSASLRTRLDLESATIGGNVFLRSAFANDITAVNTRITGGLSFQGAKVRGTLTVNGATIIHDVAIGGRNAHFSQPITARFVDFKGNLHLEGGRFKGVDLTGSAIRDELSLASDAADPERARWKPGSELTLRNARVFSLAPGPPVTWPTTIVLEGFGFEVWNGALPITENGSALLKWLRRTRPYAPSPYQRLADVMARSGRSDLSAEVLYDSADTQLASAADVKWSGIGAFGKWSGLSALRWTIGYGYGHGFFWALPWAILFVIIGVIVLYAFGETEQCLNNQQGDTVHIGTIYSLDMLIPLVELRKKHYEVDLRSAARYYFYIHKIVGYVLASFIVAGLASVGR